MRRILIHSLLIAWVVGCLVFTTVVWNTRPAAPVQRLPAATSAPVVPGYAQLEAWWSPRYLRAYHWALSQRGCWYQWGGTGPCWAGYDCSGLVYAAYRVAGVSYFGRDTYDMLASGRLHRVWWPHAGELAFFGSGHVELYAGGNWTFGAEHSGTRVGFHQWNAWWHPTAFYYVWGS